MKLSDLFQQPRSFYSQAKITKFLADERKARPFDASRSRMLLIFDTSKQRTWLVADPNQLHCVTDWAREPEPVLRWSIARARLTNGADIALDIGTADHTGDIGYVRIDGKKPRFYSKRLFSDKSINETIADFLKEAFAA